MNKKEVSEIKSLFKRDGGAIDRICGCLIDGEQQIRMTFSDMFLSLSQEEIDKYFEIFRKALSGSLGKNLHSLDYTLDQELSGEGHKRLMQLKATGLKDETVLEEFYKSVAETYHFGESYYVVMIHCNYDVPGRGSDNLDMDDASEEFKALEKNKNVCLAIYDKYMNLSFAASALLSCQRLVCATIHRQTASRNACVISG